MTTHCILSFPSIGTSITLDDVSKLVELLVPIQNKFAEIALALNVPDYVYQTSSTTKSDKIKLKDILQYWIESKGVDATWEVLFAAVEGPIVENKVIGNKLRHFRSVKESSIIGGIQ